MSVVFIYRQGRISKMYCKWKKARVRRVGILKKKGKMDAT